MLSLKRLSYWHFLGLLLGLSALLRLPYLSTIPPLGPQGIIIRIPTVIAATATIALSTEIVRKFYKDDSRALWVGAAFSIMPWHIVESRLASPVMLSLCVSLFAVYASLYPKKGIARAVVLVLGISVSFLIYKPGFFLTHLIFPTGYYFFNNIFKLVSADFLFYKNDSFWLEGLRSWGGLLPCMILPFVVGAAAFLKNFKKRDWVIILSFICTIIVTALNPTYPEAREAFFMTPFLALIIGFGLSILWKFFNSTTTLPKIVLCIWLGLVAYEHILFFHFYTTFYVKRITSEIQYEKRTF